MMRRSWTHRLVHKGKTFYGGISFKSESDSRCVKVVLAQGKWEQMGKPEIVYVTLEPHIKDADANL